MQTKTHKQKTIKKQKAFKKKKKPTKNNACVTIEEKVYYKNEYTLK